jgi:hypothetical protein
MFDTLAISYLRQDQGLFFAQLFWDDQQDGLSDDLIFRITENSFRRLVPASDDALQCLANDGIFCGLDDGRQPVGRNTSIRPDRRIGGFASVVFTLARSRSNRISIHTSAQTIGSRGGHTDSLSVIPRKKPTQGIVRFKYTGHRQPKIKFLIQIIRLLRV